MSNIYKFVDKLYVRCLKVLISFSIIFLTLARSLSLCLRIAYFKEKLFVFKKNEFWKSSHMRWPFLLCLYGSKLLANWYNSCLLFLKGLKQSLVILFFFRLFLSVNRTWWTNTHRRVPTNNLWLLCSILLSTKPIMLFFVSENSHCLLFSYRLKNNKKSQ